MNFKRILCAVDFSPTSVKAFEASVELARSFKAQLHVMHVVEAEPSVPNLALEEKAIAAMNALISSVVADDIDLTSEVTTGTAFVEILKRARELNVDLVSMGTKGLTLLEERVFGGTAKRVFSEAPCSVLAVRENGGSS
jgi:nucleotide-binding universal stress UspA family protein